MTLQGRDLVSAALKAFEARDRRQAAAHLRALDREAPNLGETWSAVSRLAMTIGEPRLAVAAARRHVALAPTDAGRRLALDGLLAQSGQVEAALADAEDLLATHPGHPGLLHFSGTCHAQLGRTEAAEAALRGALLRLPPTHAAWTWLTLVDLRTFRAGDPDIGALRELAARVREPAEARSLLLYALGKVLADSGEQDQAFAAYAEGARLMAVQRPYDVVGARRLVDRMTAEMTAGFFETLAPSRASGARPIFVLGPPRSGSTLVEQILASHSAVCGGAELNLFRAAAMGLDGFGPREIAAASARAGGADLWTAIGEDYLHLIEQRFGAEGRVIDKTLNHSRFVGLIRHVLPGARFIWLRRDVRDAGWSIFRTRFAQGLDWSWSLEAIGAHLADEERLHDHWTAQYPDDILSVPYEGLVAEPAVWMRRILEHCRLPFEPGVLEFHKTARPVQTASVAQVRRPMYATSVGGAGRYGDRLAPLLAAYNAARRS